MGLCGVGACGCASCGCTSSLPSLLLSLRLVWVHLFSPLTAPLAPHCQAAMLDNPYTIHPAPYALHPTPLHPLHPTPDSFTLIPTRALRDSFLLGDEIGKQLGFFVLVGLVCSV